MGIVRAGLKMLREKHAIFVICYIKLHELTSVYISVCVCVCVHIIIYTRTNYVKLFICSPASLTAAHFSLPSITYPNVGLCHRKTYMVSVCAESRWYKYTGSRKDKLELLMIGVRSVGHGVGEEFRWLLIPLAVEEPVDEIFRMLQ